MSIPSSPHNPRLVRFEEVTPASKIVAFLDASIDSLVADLNLSIFEGYDDLDNIRFAFLTLPSGEIVTLGQYLNSPRPGTDLYVVAITTETPKIVAESCQQLVIAKEEIMWIYPDCEDEFNILYAEQGNFSRQHESAQIIEEFGQSNLYEPIDCFQHALQIYSRQKFPEYWAMLQHNLGLAYYHRIQGSKRENLEISIKCFHNSLQVYTEEKSPEKWQINQEDLSDAIRLMESLNSTISEENMISNHKVSVLEHLKSLSLIETSELAKQINQNQQGSTTVIEVGGNLPSSRISSEIKHLKSLSLLEAAELVKQIQEAFGINVSAPVSVVMAVGSEPISEEQTEFNIVLEGLADDSKKISVLKVVRAITGLGLKEAKDLIEAVPRDVLTGIPKKAAEDAKKVIEEAGGKVVIK